MGKGWQHDLRVGVRMIRRERVTSVTALVTIAVGIWAFLTGFALLDHSLLRPLGYQTQERLLIIGAGERAMYGISLPDHRELVRGSDVFEDAALWQGWSVLLRPEEGPWARVAAASVSSSFLALLGVEPVAGRRFAPEDDLPGHTPSVVLSYATWTKRFGANRDAIGAKIEAEGGPYVIVGVAPKGFRDPVTRLFGWTEPEMWRVSPDNFDTGSAERDQVSYWSLARLRPGVAVRDAQTRLRDAAAKAYGSPDAVPGDLEARPYASLVGRHSGGSLLLLLLAGGTVLLVALANVTNLLLARGIARTHEMAIRTSLGGTRAQLIRQLLVEGGVLGVLGGALGLILTALALDPVTELSRGLLPPGTDVVIDARLGAIAFAVAVVLAVGAAVAPSLAATRASAIAALREGRGVGGRQRSLQSGLVVCQAGLAVVLVASSGLLLRSLWMLGHQDPGFTAEQVTTLRVSLYDELFGGDDDQNATLDAITERIAALPSVAAVGGITDLPLSGAVNSTLVFRTDRNRADESGTRTLVRGILPGYFESMAIPLERGRDVKKSDGPSAVAIAIVNQAFAEEVFPGEEAVGRIVEVRGVERTIVGIVANVHEFSLEGGGDPVLYQPYAQTKAAWMRASMTLTIRSGSAPSATTLSNVGFQVDRRIPLASPRPLSWYTDRAVAGYRFRAMIASAFGALALILATVGLAAVTAYAVNKRTRELGVRVALGATPGAVARLVLQGSGKLAALGLGLGVAGALFAGRALAGFLYGVSAIDPLTLSVAVCVIAVALVGGSVGPIYRAVSIDPVDALRHE